MIRQGTYRVLMVVSTILAILLFIAMKFEGRFYQVLYPLDKLATWIHECGHSFAVLLNGGQVFSIVVDGANGGYMTGAGGDPIVTAIAGVGFTVLVGTVVMYFTSRFQWGAIVLYIILIPCAVITLQYGAPDQSGSYTATVVMLFFVGLIWIIGSKTHWLIGNSLVYFLGVFLALDGFNAFWALGNLTRPDHYNDIENLHANLPFLSGNAWAFLLAGISLVAIVLSLYFSLLRVKNIKGE